MNNKILIEALEEISQHKIQDTSDAITMLGIARRALADAEREPGGNEYENALESFIKSWNGKITMNEFLAFEMGWKARPFTPKEQEES